uniref:G_PROTEIN_RECEP_F1_2 domain-containing protein n=1 Tax=Haemonchus placei TaxID=6290 RepID=A0A0N4W2J1_HAEPC
MDLEHRISKYPLITFSLVSLSEVTVISICITLPMFYKYYTSRKVTPNLSFRMDLEHRISEYPLITFSLVSLSEVTVISVCITLPMFYKYYTSRKVPHIVMRQLQFQIGLTDFSDNSVIPQAAGDYRVRCH